jgi:hypothetical protein
MSGLIRVLTSDEANQRYACCGWYSEAEPNCVRVPLFRLATPHGETDFCREHIDYMVAALPREWLDGFAYREPLTLEANDDIPF